MRRSGKRLTKQEKRLWGALEIITGVGLPNVAKIVESETGLSSADFSILSRLRRPLSGAMAQRDLQVDLGWDKTRLSHQLTRMEARELVKRMLDARGRVIIKMQPTGTAAIEIARRIHASAFRDKIVGHIDGETARGIIRLALRISDSQSDQPGALA